MISFNNYKIVSVLVKSRYFHIFVPDIFIIRLITWRLKKDIIGKIYFLLHAKKTIDLHDTLR